MLGNTKLEMEEKLKEGAAWIVAAIVGVGVALTLTIIFVALGMKLILAGTAIGTIGWGMAKLVPHLSAFHTIKCPKCLTDNEVRPHVAKFSCAGCGKSLYGQAFWKKGTGHGRRRILVSGKKFTSIKEKFKQVEQESRVQ